MRARDNGGFYDTAMSNVTSDVTFDAYSVGSIHDACVYDHLLLHLVPHLTIVRKCFKDNALHKKYKHVDNCTASQSSNLLDRMASVLKLVENSYTETVGYMYLPL